MTMRRFGPGAAFAVTIGVSLLAGGAGSAQAATAEDPPAPAIAFDSPTLTIEYGQPWYFQATGRGADTAEGEWPVTGAFTGGPSGYSPVIGWYRTDSTTVIGYLTPPDAARPLPAGHYSATLSMTPGDGTGTPVTTATPATLTVNPAALGISLQVTADPSNPSNAILSAAFTGAFVDSFFSTAVPTGPLSPAGAWRITVTDSDGEVVHDFSADRTDQDDVMAVSSYWSDVAPGQYTVRATFTPSGPGSSNFALTQPGAVAFTSAPPPGATSTATAAPPAPPVAEDAGTTLPGWIPVAAGVLSAGLLALTVVQIVRLRRSAVPLGQVAP